MTNNEGQILLYRSGQVLGGQNELESYGPRFRSKNRLPKLSNKTVAGSGIGTAEVARYPTTEQTILVAKA